ncbi:hypothetical protein GEMRC1_012201 [Eukaryota sp. GEM-RC1]
MLVLSNHYDSILSSNLNSGFFADFFVPNQFIGLREWIVAFIDQVFFIHSHLYSINFKHIQQIFKRLFDQLSERFFTSSENLAMISDYLEEPQSFLQGVCEILFLMRIFASYLTDDAISKFSDTIENLMLIDDDEDDVDTDRICKEVALPLVTQEMKKYSHYAVIS